MLAGRPHEAAGNGSPRWMTAAPRERGTEPGLQAGSPPHSLLPVGAQRGAPAITGLASGQGKKPGPNRVRAGQARYPRGGAGLPGSNKGYPLADSSSARCSGESALIVAIGVPFGSAHHVVDGLGDRRLSARSNRHRRLLTSNARAVTARSAAVGMETSSPVIRMDLISAGYGETVPETLRPNLNLLLPERRCALLMPRCRDAAMPRCRDAAMPRCRDAAMPRCRDAAMPRCRDAAMPLARKPDW